MTATINGTDSRDNGGTANGGVNESPTQTFTVTVTPVNDAPVAVNDTATMTEDSAGTSGTVLGQRHRRRHWHDADGDAAARAPPTAP